MTPFKFTLMMAAVAGMLVALPAAADPVSSSSPVFAVYEPASQGAAATQAQFIFGRPRDTWRDRDWYGRGWGYDRFVYSTDRFGRQWRFDRYTGQWTLIPTYSYGYGRPYYGRPYRDFGPIYGRPKYRYDHDWRDRDLHGRDWRGRDWRGRDWRGRDWQDKGWRDRDRDRDRDQRHR